MPYYLIELNSATVGAILSGDPASVQMLRSDILECEDELLHAMTHFCHDDRGTPLSGSLNLEADPIEIRDDLTGELIVEFEEFADYSCDNMNVRAEHEVEVPFRILIDSRQIQLEVPVSSRYSYWHRGEKEEEAE